MGLDGRSKIKISKLKESLVDNYLHIVNNFNKKELLPKGIINFVEK